MTRRQAIFVTGSPGSGKSTLAMRIARSIRPSPVRGLLTSEVRINGERQGFAVTDLASGETGALASPAFPGQPRFGTEGLDGVRRLGIDLTFLEEVICPSLIASQAVGDASTLILDEVGPMQAASSYFRMVVSEILSKTDVPVFGTIAAEGACDWIDGLHHDEAVAIIPMNRSNRQVISDALTDYMTKAVDRDHKT